MRYLVPIAVFMLMASIGMSLKGAEVVSRVRHLTWQAWLRLVLAAFILPAAFALILASLFRLTDGDLAGIFMVGVTPGAPLLTRNMARKGFDMHLAATYQLWAALMVPIMVPIVVAAGASLYNREIWISPAELLKQVAFNQLLPLALGAVVGATVPAQSRKYQPTLNSLGNILLMGLIVVALFKMGPALIEIPPSLPLVALLLALGCIGAIRMVRLNDRIAEETFAICNANRYVGLALLLTGEYLHSRRALPSIACYALLAPVVMIVYAKWYGGRGRDEMTSVPGRERSVASS